MELNDLLRKANPKIDLSHVLILRHRPKESELNKVLPLLAAERPDLFNAYQQTQGQSVERAMLRTSFVASFIGHEPGKALFVGLYTVGKSKPLTREGYWRIREHIELKQLGMNGFTEKDSRREILWFDLELERSFYTSWKGKLIVRWPGNERSWWRRADKNKMDVLAIHEESVLVGQMPKWDQVNWTWDFLQNIPEGWRLKLSQWRGIYFIFDQDSKKGYVGSACGEDNLLQRWKCYAATGHGGNKLLRSCNREHLHFSILELVAQTMPSKEVIDLEQKWKARLHTRSPNGLNYN